MYPNQLYPVLKKHWENPDLRKKSIYLEGKSGIGKSQMVHQLAEEFRVPFPDHSIDKRFSQMDAVDLGGTPWNKDGWTRWSPPDWLDFSGKPEGILFMDEITSASREVFAASYQLFLDRQINGAKVPEGWMIIAAGNGVSDRGVINQMPSPLLNRFLKIVVEPHLDSWRDLMGKRGLDPRLLAWISHQPQYLHNFTSEIATQNESFCTPRSIVETAPYLDWEDAERVEMLRGRLGREGASSLESFLRLYTRLPSKDEVLSNPKGCRIPDENALGERYAMAMMCSAAMDRTTFEKLWVYVDRLGAQFIVLATRLAMQRDMTIGTARGYRDFSSKHAAVFSRS